ncbi:diguanylate cyclase (GGDEF)-like protein [Alteromonadaceae bacterium 2753L.S.0a.02]|nr:diguanylate cyclase (GGDEF)-like protein [Alteromonadaceae bacterium 2753L.S.0a.02]
MSQPTRGPIFCGNPTAIAADELDPRAMQFAFSLSAELVGCTDYHSLTHKLIQMLSQLPGVEYAAAYEVFSQAIRHEQQVPKLLFRRFPLSLDDNYQDENTALLRFGLESSCGGIRELEWCGESYFLLDVLKEVNPRRAVVIKARLNAHYKIILQGLFEVYSYQTALLDRKERDLLTQLLNRQSLDHLISQILEHFRSSPELQPSHDSWLAVLDIDYFKKVNDEFGHLFGDEVLIHFANLMKQHFRISDYLFRFGGEEFLVVLNRVTERQAYEILDDFRTAVADHTFPSGRITTSVGFASIGAASNISSLLERADMAVYAAKDKGRNQTVNYVTIADDYSAKRFGGDDIELF